METLPIVNGSLDSWFIRADGTKVYGNYYQKDGQIFHKCNNPVKLIRFYHKPLGMKMASTTKAMKEGLPMLALL